MRSKLVIIITVTCVATYAIAANTGGEMASHNQHTKQTPQLTVLSEAGNDAFGTIQEVISKLNNDPNTDWSKVNLEKLRKHLVDMNNMTLHVEVISQVDTENGLGVIVKPTTESSKKTLNRVFKVHPSQLKMETGWDMTVKTDNGKYILRITTVDKRDVSKIRGLGYIGLMAYGVHHQKHHWDMARGEDPHKMSH